MADGDIGEDTQRTPKTAQMDGAGGRDSERQNLLTMDPDDAARRLVDDWKETTKRQKNLREIWKLNVYRSKGYTGARLLVKQQNVSAYIPDGSAPCSAAMNEQARLKSKLRGVLFADPPKPECLPSTDTDEDVDAAELATRILEHQFSEGGLEGALTFGDTFDLASDYGSGFIWYYVDPTAGGWQAKEIEAHSNAVSADAPTIDPATGVEAPENELVLRYVTMDGSLGDDAADEDVVREWTAGIKQELLTGKHVHFHPPTVRDLWDADGVSIGTMIPLGALKSIFPKTMSTLKDGDLRGLMDADIPEKADLLPPHLRYLVRDADKPTDDVPVFVVTRYLKGCRDYPTGAYLVAAGNGKLLYRGPWYDATHGEPLDLPVTQIKQLFEDGNPYGQGISTYLGPGNDVLAQMMGAQLDHLARFGEAHVFIPLHGTLTPEQLQSRYVQIIPGAQPFYEQVPDFPATVEKMQKLMYDNLQHVSRLEEVGQGVNSANVQSGQQAQTIIDQVNAGMSDLRQGAERGIVRAFRIVLQLDRAFLSRPQEIRVVGDDGAFKVRAWSNSDLSGTRDVRMAKGSFTQLTPAAKTNAIAALHQAGYLAPPEALHATIANIGGTLALDDNPHRNRVRGQIAAWRQGPRASVATNGMPASPPVGPDGQPQIVPDPEALRIFTPRSVDEQPDVAQIRYYELGRAMATIRWGAYSPEWQQPFVAAYEASRQAAGVQTVAEQQQAAQAQAQATQQAEQQKMAVEQEKTAAETDIKRQELALKQQQAAQSPGALLKHGMRVVRDPNGDVQGLEPNSEPQAVN